jgi:type I restriction enzyme S subunit
VKKTQMPLPPADQQDEIVSHLELIDSKHDQAEAKQKALQDLFRSLLHELMTAKTRVHDLEIAA